MLERISRVRSGRSLSYEGESSASVATYEFDNMEVVRDTTAAQQNGNNNNGNNNSNDNNNKRKHRMRGRKWLVVGRGRAATARIPNSSAVTGGGDAGDDDDDDHASSDGGNNHNRNNDDEDRRSHSRISADRLLNAAGGDDDDDDTDVPLLDSGRKNGGDNTDDSDKSDRSYSFRTSSTSSTSGFSRILPNRTVALSTLIGLLGIVSSTLFLGFGIQNAVEDQDKLFVIRANELTQEFRRAWKEYTVASLWVHQACAFSNISRTDFTHVYHYVSSQFDVAAVEWIPKVLDENRLQLEEESLQYYQTHHPEIDYRGIQGIQLDDWGGPSSSWSLAYRSTQEFYYPIHWIEPINDEMNARSIEIDALSSPLHDHAVELALETFLPVATEAYRRLGASKGDWTEDTFVQLLHPGIPMPATPDEPDQQPRDLAGLVIRLQNVVESATLDLPTDVSIFLYDSTNDGEEPTFLIAAEVYSQQQEDMEEGERIKYLEEISLSELLDETVYYMHITQIQVASRTWTMATVALEDTFVPDLRYIILAGKFILIASMSISLWILTSYRRTKTLLEVRRKADMEKAAVIVRSARENARVEQELNDYIAHEVRNPLAAAMSACTFVKAGIHEKNPLSDPKTLQAIREDVEIIDSSLTFTHDLLRNMLDMHRAANRVLVTEDTPLDILHDIIQPVLAMLYQRDLPFETLAECPTELFVLSDRLRLKQILLNLCRNSAKYVQKGFIKVGACVIDDKLQFYVEDSGFGISEQRRKNLFSKFQESLEIMDQGSGVGLCLCKSMANLLEGDIWLDESYNSGIEGFPGSRFVIGLNKGPMTENEVKDFVTSSDTTTATHEDSLSNDSSSKSQTLKSGPQKRRPSVDFSFHTAALQTSVEEAPPSVPPRSSEENANAATTTTLVQPDVLPAELPKGLSVLFVDDDMILRKLFMRSVRKVVDSWDIQEAASGEAALQLTDQREFSIIFMDQYMASVEKKLLGTETVRALRSKGVQSRICGLSANDVEDGFWNAGADCFMFKPFPCKNDQLTAELHRILNAPRHPKLDELTAVAPPKVPREYSESKSKSDMTNDTIVEEESKEMLSTSFRKLQEED